MRKLQNIKEQGNSSTEYQKQKKKKKDNNQLAEDFSAGKLIQETMEALKENSEQLIILSEYRANKHISKIQSICLPFTTLSELIAKGILN